MSKIKRLAIHRRERQSYYNNHICFNGGNTICEFCEGQTVKKKVKKHHLFHVKLYIVENVDAAVCLECGERYFQAKILDEIDNLLKAKHDVKERIVVEVVSL